MLFDLFRKKTYPPFWQSYLEGFKKPLPENTPVEDIRFVVLDTETTGLSVKKDKILSIAAIGVMQNSIRLEDTFECLVNQGVKTGESAAVHGILATETSGGLSESAAIEQFVGFCRNSVIVGQHIGFDIAMLNEAIKPLTGERLKNKSLDTARMAVRLDYPYQNYFSPDNPEAYSLDALCNRFNVAAEERHTAPGDAYMTAVLFLKLLSRLKHRGVQAWGDLMDK